jgi:DNA replication protein DnaC
MNAATDPAQALLDLYCRELKLPGLRQAAPAVAREAAEQNQSYTAFLTTCLAQELTARREHHLRQRLAQARFPAPKTLESFDFLAIPELPKAKVLTLATGAFLRTHENIICLGNPGTGKTHTAIGIALGCIQAGARVRFIPAVTLAQELLAAQQEFRLPRYLKSWQPVDLVVLDELGYLGLGPGGPLLFQFCAERYERGSLLLTSNLDFSRWVEVFGDPSLTAALLDRLTHHAHVLLFRGESYRFRESHQHLREGTDPLVPPPTRGAGEEGGSDGPHNPVA